LLSSNLFLQLPFISNSQTLSIELYALHLLSWYYHSLAGLCLSSIDPFCLPYTFSLIGHTHYSNTCLLHTITTAAMPSFRAIFALHFANVLPFHICRTILSDDLLPLRRVLYLYPCL
jgi:hypothetical protein